MSSSNKYKLSSWIPFADRSDIGRPVEIHGSMQVYARWATDPNPPFLSLSESKRLLFTHQLSLLSGNSVFIQHVIYKTQVLKIEEMKC